MQIRIHDTGLFLLIEIGYYTVFGPWKNQKHFYFFTYHRENTLFSIYSA
jgi:hypothetical protein